MSNSNAVASSSNVENAPTPTQRNSDAALSTKKRKKNPKSKSKSQTASVASSSSDIGEPRTKKKKKKGKHKLDSNSPNSEDAETRLPDPPEGLNSPQKPKRRKKKSKGKGKGTKAPNELEEGEVVSGSESKGFEENADFIPLLPPSEDEEPVSDAKDTRREDRRREDRRSNHPPYHTRTHDPKPNNWGKGFDPLSTRKAPWCDMVDLKSCRNVAELLHEEVAAFTKYMSPTPVEDEIRGMIVLTIQRAIMTTFPDAQVLPFGSYETKLYLPSGDIDLVILSNTMMHQPKLKVLHLLAATLKDAGITSKVQIIAKAKVPIVKFVSTWGRFNVDVSVNQANGLKSLNIIKAFLGDESESLSGGIGFGMGVALRALVLVTKQYLSQRQMNEVFTGGLGSYSIVCLAISFLQMHPKIRSGHINPSQNLGVLVLEFFELYGVYFNYEDVGISLADGGSYYVKRHRGWYDYYNSRKLSIEDPADDTNDISVGSYGFQRVRTTLAGAYSILTSQAYLRAGMLGSRMNGTSVDLHGAYDRSDEYSILASIVSLDQEMINHRKLVYEVWEQGRLHRQAGVQSQLMKDGDGNIVWKPMYGYDYVPGAMAYGTMQDDSDCVIIEGPEKGKQRSKEGSGEAISGAGIKHKEPIDIEDVEEEGRYGIGKPPPSKRRRVGDEKKDIHTVYTSESDSDEDNDSSESMSISTGSETSDLIITHVNLGGEGKVEKAVEKEDDLGKEKETIRAKRSRTGKRTRGRKSKKVERVSEEKEEGQTTEEEKKYPDPEGEAKDRRRSYWLSKGIDTNGEDSA